MFKLVTDLPSRNANWSYGGPTNWTNLGVAVLDAPVGGRLQSDPANKYLDLYNRFDTMSKLKAPKNVMNPIIDFTSGHTISIWLTLNQVPENRTRTLFWCGVNGPTIPNQNAIVFEFLPPNRRLQVQITNTYHWAYLQPPQPPQYPLGFPYKVYTNCACGGTNSTIPVDRWFQIIVQVDWNNTISIFQNGFPLAKCYCDIMPQFFRDTCVLGKSANSFYSTFGKKDYIAAPNYYAPLNGSIAAFDWWPRILMKQEFDAITQSPPHTLWAFPMEFRENMTFQRTTLQQNGTFTVTPGLSVWSGLYITPLLETPTWYNPGPLILKIANLSSNDYDTTQLKFHPLSLQNTITFEVSWPANIPYAMVPLNLSNMAHYQYPINCQRTRTQQTNTRARRVDALASLPFSACARGWRRCCRHARSCLTPFFFICFPSLSPAQTLSGTRGHRVSSTSRRLRSTPPATRRRSTGGRPTRSCPTSVWRWSTTLSRRRRSIS